MKNANLVTARRQNFFPAMRVSGTLAREMQGHRQKGQITFPQLRKLSFFTEASIGA
jgi:hypothetical protein